MRSASGCIGRVGGLAVFLGVGVALATGCGVATADAGSSDTSPSSTGKPAHSNAAHSSPTSNNPSAGKQASKAASSGAAAAAASGGAVSVSGPGIGDVKSSTVSGKRSKRGIAMRRELSSSAMTAVETSNSGTAAGVEISPGPIAAAPSALSAGAGPFAPASTASVVSTPSPLDAAPVLRSMPSLTATSTEVMNPNTLRPKFSPLAFVVGGLAVGVDYVLAVSRQLALATYWRSTPDTVNPTLELNGYNLVASSTQDITSFYGNWTNWPGGPTTVQGRQQFDVVDPQTGAEVGSFDALVSSGSPLLLGAKTVELLVISPNGPQSGTGPGEIPPYGSLIANQTFGPLGFGWSYSDMPTDSGTDVISFKLLTPFGDFAIPNKYDPAKGIADHTVDNSPIDLGNGYSIVPADPDGETFTAITGVLPIFSALQGHQKYNVVNSDGVAVGSFEGVFTPTVDSNGAHTEAILVTHTYGDGSNVGTNPGDVPPVGSVYNVLYLKPGTSGRYFLYSSLPSQSGDVISFLDNKSGIVSNVGTFLFTRLNASAPPAVYRMATAAGNSFYPISPLEPSGVNGLPPREAEVQGYQQFGVYDSTGTQTGSFDADVSTQWDVFGVYSRSVLVTRVTDGTVGTNAGDVPPVGSVFEYVYISNSGLGTYYSAMPSPSGAITTYKLMTPLVDIPLFTKYDASKNPTDYTFYDPFPTV